MKKLIYVQENPEEGIQTATIKPVEYKLKSKDILYIKIISSNEKLYALFNNDAAAPNTNNTELSTYLNSYEVNDSGFVQLPVIGKIFIKDKTLEQARETLQQSAEKYLKDATIICKMLNFQVTVLGEVVKPGLYKVYDTKLNLFDAIGLAGDLSIYGNRKDIKIIRTNEDGTNSIIKVDLTKSKLINSPEYNLRPNDIVYVPVLRTKTLGFGTFPFATVLTAISTTVLVINILNK